MKTLDLNLYFITDSTGFSEEEFLKRVELALQGKVTLVQLREKNRSTREYIELAEKVHQLTKKYEVPLIIDDRIDVAMAVNAEGVHVGQSDMPVKIARKLLGPDKIIGATAKTVPQAIEAYEQGADYLGVGAIYPTTTKVVKIARKLLGPDKIIGATAKTVPQAIEAYEQGADYLGVGAIYPTTTKVKTVLTSTDTLREICKAVPIPANAIGGLNKENIHVLKGIPIAGICVVSAIMKAENPKQAARVKQGKYPCLKRNSHSRNLCSICNYESRKSKTGSSRITRSSKKTVRNWMKGNKFMRNYTTQMDAAKRGIITPG